MPYSKHGTLQFLASLCTAVMFVIVVLFAGTVVVAEKVLPFLWATAHIAMVFCIVVLLPLSLLRRTRIVPACGFLIVSNLFGLGTWMYSFLVVYDLWGERVSFLACFSEALGLAAGHYRRGAKQDWLLVGELVYCLVVTFGAGMFAFNLAKTLDRATQEGTAP